MGVENFQGVGERGPEILKEVVHDVFKPVDAGPTAGDCKSASVVGPVVAWRACGLRRSEVR